MRLRLRHAAPSIALLRVRSVIIEALGGVTIELSCRNVSTGTDRLLKLEFPDPASLEFQITPNPEDNISSDSRS